MKTDDFDARADRLLAIAERAAETCSDWTDIYNAVAAPGVTNGEFPTQELRERFVRSPQYAQIAALADEARRRGAAGLPSGKFLVRLPKSLHASLVREAEAEGVSLNQLVATRLAAGPPRAA